MAHTYTNTRAGAVRVFTSTGPVTIPGHATVTFKEPISSAPYWIVKAEEVREVTEVSETTVICATVEETEETTKARRRRCKTTTTEEE